MNPFIVPATEGSDPGQLIAAVPQLLHQTPQEAFVLLLARRGLIRDHRVFPLDCSPRLLFARMTHQLATVDADTAYLIGIAAAITATPNGFAHMPAPFSAVPGAVTNTLAENGITAAGIWGTPTLAPAAPWWTLAGIPRTGILHDPHQSTDPGPTPILAALHDPRAEAIEIFAQSQEFTALLTAALPAAQHESEHRLAAAIRRGTPDQHFATELDTIRDHLLTLSHYGGPEDTALAPLLAPLCVTLRCDRVRSALYEHIADPTPWFRPGTTPNVDMVLWATLVTGTLGTDRAHAATLLALALYLRGDDIAAAEVAIDIAVHADPHHHVAPAVHEAIRQRQHPTELRAAFQHRH